MERQYRDSGIEWIGRIPQDWEVLPHKHLMYKSKVICDKYQGEDIISLTLNGVIVRDLTAGGKMPTTFDGYQFVNPGDLLMCLFDIDVTPRCVGFVTSDGLTSPAYSRFKTKKGAYGPYYDYLLRYMDDEKCLLHLSKNLRSSLTEVDFGQILSIKPPYSEQKKIADYLDKKCAEIDELIEVQEVMIQKLTDYKQSVITEAVTKGLNPYDRLVPSGIDWIGDVPKGWKFARMDYICSVITDFVASGSFESLRENVPYLDTPDYAMLVRTTDLSGTAKSDKRVYISKHSYNFLKNSNLFGEEIVLPNIGASVGDVYMVPAGLYEKMSLGPNSIMLKTKYCDRYYYYYYYGEPGKRSVINMCQSTAQPKFNKTELRSLRVLLPPLEEQRAIASYLDGKCAEIDSLISLKQQKKEKLKEYKKSLIYEAVTGKIKIQ